jgi:hypothetical protein
LAFEFWSLGSASDFLHPLGVRFARDNFLLRIFVCPELADELGGLNAEEREQLKNSFPDLVKNTPKTAVAETRFKKLMKKAGSEAYDGMKSILVDVVSEAVKKPVFGG